MIWALLAVLVDVSLARIAFGALVPSLRSDLGFDLAAIGSISAANAVGYLITSGLAPWIARYLDMRKLAILSHIVAAAGFAAAACSSSFLVLVLARGIAGIGGGAGIVACLGLALDAVEPRRRVFVSTLAWSGLGLGLVVAAAGQPWLYAPSSWRVASGACAALALFIAISTPGRLLARSEGISRPAETPRRDQWRKSGFILASIFLFGVGFLAYSTFAAVVSVQTTPLISFLTTGFSALAGSVLVMRVTRAERALGAMMLMGAVGGVLTVVGSPIGGMFFGFGLTAIAGLSTATLRERTGVATQAVAMCNIVVGAGQFVGPVVAGVAAQAFGTAWAPGIAGAAYALGAVAVGTDAVLRRRGKAAAV